MLADTYHFLSAVIVMGLFTECRRQMHRTHISRIEKRGDEFIDGHSDLVNSITNIYETAKDYLRNPCKLMSVLILMFEN